MGSLFHSTPDEGIDIIIQLAFVYGLASALHHTLVRDYVERLYVSVVSIGVCVWDEEVEHDQQKKKKTERKRRGAGNQCF